MVKLLINTKPHYGYFLLPKTGETRVMIDVETGKPLLDFCFENGEITEEQWRSLHLQLLQTNLPTDITKTLKFAIVAKIGITALDLMASALRHALYVLGHIDLEIICDAPDEILQPEFVVCEGCNKSCAMIFINDHERSNKLRTKEQAYSKVSEYFKEERVSEYAMQRLTDQITEAEFGITGRSFS